MQCRNCDASNDTDAVYCVQCGKPVGEEKKATWTQRKIILGVLLLLIVMAGAAVVGYYKFILPDGVAAVVNGEVIRLSELNAEVSRTGGAPQESGTSRPKGDAAAGGGRRYQVLNRMITDRLALQEARKAGFEVSASELSAALAHLQTVSQYEKNKFNELVAAQYGSLRAFEQRLSQDLLINKYITGRIVPAGADPGIARAAVARWLQDLSRTAAIPFTPVVEGRILGGPPQCGSRLPNSGPPQAAVAATEARPTDPADRARQPFPRMAGPPRMRPSTTGVNGMAAERIPPAQRTSGATFRSIFCGGTRSSGPSGTRTAIYQKSNSHATGKTWKRDKLEPEDQRRLTQSRKGRQENL